MLYLLNGKKDKSSNIQKIDLDRKLQRKIYNTQEQDKIYST